MGRVFIIIAPAIGDRENTSRERRGDRRGVSGVGVPRFVVEGGSRIAVEDQLSAARDRDDVIKRARSIVEECVRGARAC